MTDTTPDSNGERIIHANNIDICTESFGDPDHPCILLIMGAGSSMLLWEDEFCQRLAHAGRFVIRYDNRDTGKTTSCPLGQPNYTIQDMAADGPAVLDAYGVQQAHIIGASMGGMIAQLIALDHPQRALTLTPIMSTPDPGVTLDAIDGDPDTAQSPLSPPSPEVLALVGQLATLDWNDRDAVLENRTATFRTLAGSAYPFNEDQRHTFARELDRALNFPSTANHGPAIAQSQPWRHRLSQLQLPTLVIHGNDDPILPLDHGQALAHEIPNARLLTLQGVGHELPHQVWDTVIPAILQHTA